MLFIGTFFICLFIFMMQFLWRYVDELVGKGLDMSVIAQFFFYSALTLVPISLPLAILLASLITFGNFGERYELLAMKAAGISLLKIMRPLAFFVCGLVAVSFYFQNVVAPIAQTKLYTLIISMKQKSPELDIPEGVFYSEIPDYNLKIKQRPMITFFDSTFIMLAHGLTAFYVSVYLIRKYGNFNSHALFEEFVITVVVLSGICTALAVIGIWGKDNSRYFQLDKEKKNNIHFRDYWQIMKHNKPIRMLVIAAASNKFASMVYSTSTAVLPTQKYDIHSSLILTPVFFWQLFLSKYWPLPNPEILRHPDAYNLLHTHCY